MLKVGVLIGTLGMVVFMTACRNHAPTAAEAKPTSPVPVPTDAWLGRWSGPEGTYLQLAKDGDKYVVEVQDLDGLKSFAGFPDGNRIRFVRDGKTEFLFEGNGRATGMKWLADKKDCLLTKAGEGWCRD